jgi:hypothetical protein
MQRLLARLERTLGRYAIPNLTWYIVGLGAVVFVLELAKPGFTSMLVLDPALVMHGQVWRLVTYLFIPPAAGPIWILFALYMTWMFGTSLEAEWGAFRYNIFYLIGMAGTTAAAFLTGEPVTNIYLNTTLFLAFATLFPDYQILLFFILPIKVKWLGWLAAAGLLVTVLTAPLGHKAAVAFALVNYLVFFQGTIRNLMRRGSRKVQSVAQRSKFEPPLARVRKCSLCGKTDAEPDVDIRVCSCERCGKPTELCLEHARNH